MLLERIYLLGYMMAFRYVSGKMSAVPVLGCRNCEIFHICYSWQLVYQTVELYEEFIGSHQLQFVIIVDHVVWGDEERPPFRSDEAVFARFVFGMVFHEAVLGDVQPDGAGSLRAECLPVCGDDIIPVRGDLDLEMSGGKAWCICRPLSGRLRRILPISVSPGLNRRRG